MPKLFFAASASQKRGSRARSEDGLHEALGMLVLQKA